MTRRAGKLFATFATIALASGSLACGGDEQVGRGSGPVTESGGLYDTYTEPPATETQAAPAPAETTPTVPAPAPTTVEQQEGGAGDEEAVRIPAAYEIRGTAVRPRAVDVPAFLPVELSFAAVDGKAHTVFVNASLPITIRVPKGGTGRRRVAGLKRGVYAVIVDGNESGAFLRVGQSEPGP